MIRSEHAIVEFDFDRQTIKPDRLLRGRDAIYLDAAAECLAIYADGVGQTRQMLHRDVDQRMSAIPGCSPRRAAAFCKLLDDASQYTGAGRTALELRRKVFAFGASRHPILQRREGIFESDLQTARCELESQLQRSWSEIEANLFSDVMELNRLQSIDQQLSPRGLLARYNVAQTQAALYRAIRLRIDALDDFKTILRHAKLAGLMHRVAPIKSSDGRCGYRLELDGPQSSLRETTRYGARFAAMLPKLLACRDWNLTAQILGPRQQRFRMTLSPKDGLRSELRSPDEFDSALEREVDLAWKSNPVDGWHWQHESQLLVSGQTVVTPDFTLWHAGHRRLVYVEVVGFWTPEYLQKKCDSLRHFLSIDPKELAKRVDPSGKTRVGWLLVVPRKMTDLQKESLSQLPIPTVVLEPKKTAAERWVAAIQLDQNV
ncbi:MAG: DUF790 family protein [Planctomycetota bacterium]